MLLEGITGDRLDPKRRAVCDDLDFAWPKPKMIAELFRDNQSSCLIDGCAHA
jgi:hypothetical protein